MGNDHQIMQWAERYLAGELSTEDRSMVEDRLAQDAVFAAAFQDALSLLQSLEGAGRDKRFRALLKDIHHEQATAPASTPSKTIPLRTHYWRTAAVAAGVALLTSLSAGWMLTHRSKTDKKIYTQISRDLAEVRRSQEEVKRSQKTIMDSLNGSKSPAADANRSGTGFALTNNGYLVTSYHVVSDADSLYIQTRKGRYYKAFLKAFDQQADIAILEIADNNFRFGKGELPYAFAGTKAVLGARVYTLGFPQDEIVYSEGYISSRNGFQGDSMQYRLELPSDPGQSGAPVLDASGNIVGILTAKGAQTEGTTYAVSTKPLLNFVRTLPKGLNIQLPRSNKITGLSREQQLEKLQDYTCMVLVYKK